jgi:lipid-A-disaccharide synthase-like uncharacterized protein
MTKRTMAVGVLACVLGLAGQIALGVETPSGELGDANVAARDALEPAPPVEVLTREQLETEVLALRDRLDIPTAQREQHWLLDLVYNLGDRPVKWSVVWWALIGFVGQGLFFSRFVVQWIATEIKKTPTVPVAFWYLSLAGSAITLSYAISIGSIVFILAFCLNMLIYLRNLYYIHIHPRKQAKAETLGEKDMPEDR